MSGPSIGAEAPDFTLPSTADGDVTLSQFRGKSNVVLAFFPLAFTSVCTAEFCDFTDGLTDFGAVDAEVLGISVDSVPTLTEFRAKNSITVTLLSDFKRDVCRAYGTLLEEQFFSRRSYFVVDRRGVLRWSHAESELGQKRANTELIKELENL
ncbi:MAG: redoxin domain-containing protein [Gemmatimonadales bacterium]